MFVMAGETSDGPPKRLCPTSGETDVFILARWHAIEKKHVLGMQMTEVSRQDQLYSNLSFSR